MALLVAGFAVVAVVDADDRKIGRIHHCRGRERPDVHEEFAVPGDHQHPPLRACEGETESHRGRGAHRAREREHVRCVVTQEREVAGGSGEAGHDEEVLVVCDELRHRLVAVEEEIGRRCGSVHERWISGPFSQGRSNCVHIGAGGLGIIPAKASLSSYKQLIRRRNHWIAGSPFVPSYVPFLVDVDGLLRTLALPMPHNVNGALVLREVVHC